jgi:hypothetical protein
MAKRETGARSNGLSRAHDHFAGIASKATVAPAGVMA